MPQVTDQPQQGALKGRESLTTTEFPAKRQTILGLGAVEGGFWECKGRAVVSPGFHAGSTGPALDGYPVEWVS